MATRKNKDDAAGTTSRQPGHEKPSASPPSTTGNTRDDAWARRVLDRLKSELWNPASRLDQLGEARMDEILERLRVELWTSPVDARERDAWADRIIRKLRDDLWSMASGDSRRPPTPDETSRVDAILARLKHELWDR
ncbi:MAG: hypothetical protein GYA24_16165 [Candidatus Lokiarchaeota archaeon]|nr:hypothetical protein [Candidatus Lokiarchaeota archaeon]